MSFSMHLWKIHWLLEMVTEKPEFIITERDDIRYIIMRSPESGGKASEFILATIPLSFSRESIQNAIVNELKELFNLEEDFKIEY